MNNNIYNILGKLKSITDTAALTPESSTTTPLYESVAPRGSITEAVKSLEDKFAVFKEGKLDDLRDARAEKEATANAWDKTNKETSKNKQVVKGRSYGADADKETDLDESNQVSSLAGKAPIKKGAIHRILKLSGTHNLGYTTDQLKKLPLRELYALETKLAREYSKTESNLDETTENSDTIYGAVIVNGIEYLDNEIATIDPNQRLAYGRNWTYAGDQGFDESNIFCNGQSFGGKNGLPEFLNYYANEKHQDVNESAGTSAVNLLLQLVDNSGMFIDESTVLDAKQFGNKIRVACYDPNDNEYYITTFFIDEDGETGDFGGAPDESFRSKKQMLTAFAGLTEGVTSSPRGTKSTYNAGQRAIKNMQAAKKEREKQEQANKAPGAKVTQEGVEFKDTIKNSQAKLTKAKKAVVKEGRDHSKSEYTYELIASRLASEQPRLDVNSNQFADAVYHELVAIGLTPKSARNLVHIDDDFLSDTATAYNYELNSVTESSSALAELTKLAGISKPLEPGLGSEDTLNEIGDDTNDLLDYNAELSFDNGDDFVDNNERYTGYNEWEQAIAETTAGNYVLTNEGDTISAHQTNIDGNSTYSPDELVGVWDENDGEGIIYDAVQIGETWDDTVYESYDPLDPAYATKREDLPEGKLDDLRDARAEKEATANAWDKKGNKTDSATTVKGSKYGGSKQADEKDDLDEDINVNVSASGEEDALNLFRKLAGLALSEPKEVEFDSGIDEDRDIEYSNTPREKTAPVDAAIPSGTDLNRSKHQDPRTANRAANPLKHEAEKVDEANVSALWNKYTGMLKGLIK